MTTLEKLKEIRERADKTPSSPMERTDFIYNSKIDTTALVEALMLAITDLNRIVGTCEVYRGNTFESDGSRIARHTLAQIEQIMTGEG
jgi:hypothetical protein